MKYTQGNIDFDFKKSNIESEEWYSEVTIKSVDVEFCINEEYFENKSIDWDFVEKFTSHFIQNFDFIFRTSQIWAIKLYNGYGNRIDEIDKFSRDNCSFSNLLLVNLAEATGYLYPKRDLSYLVDNVFDSEFTYLTSNCIFADYRESYFVGIIASSAQM